MLLPGALVDGLLVDGIKYSLSIALAALALERNVLMPFCACKSTIMSIGLYTLTGGAGPHRERFGPLGDPVCSGSNSVGRRLVRSSAGAAVAAEVMLGRPIEPETGASSQGWLNMSRAVARRSGSYSSMGRRNAAMSCAYSRPVIASPLLWFQHQIGQHVRGDNASIVSDFDTFKIRNPSSGSSQYKLVRHSLR